MKSNYLVFSIQVEGGIGFKNNYNIFEDIKVQFNINFYFLNL